MIGFIVKVMICLCELMTCNIFSQSSYLGGAFVNSKKVLEKGHFVCTYVLETELRLESDSY